MYQHKPKLNLLDLLQEDNQVQDNWKCVHCKILTVPMYQKADCGCRICESCITQHASIYIPCIGPSEDCSNSFLISAALNDTTRKVFMDYAINREIYKQIIKCPFPDCTEKDSVKIIINTHMDQCQYGPQICPTCTEYVESIQSHLCPKRLIQCTECKQMICLQELDAHYDYVKNRDTCCEQKEYNCKFCNDSNVYNKLTIQQHLNECSNKPCYCKYKEYGCDVFLSEADLVLHYKDHLAEHNQMFLTMYNASVVDIPQFVDLVTTLYSRADYIANKVTNNTILDPLRSVLRERIPPPNLIRQLVPDNGTSDVNRMKSEYEHLVSSVNKTGTLIWKFTDFERKQRSGTYFDSEPFYTSPMGYHLRMRCYPKGNGRAMGQYLSLYYAIVPGEYDDILSWPMLLHVSCEIINQSNVRGKRQTYCMGVDRDPFKKPLPYEANIAVGNPRFIPLSEIPTFIKNDALMFRCISKVGHST